MTSEPDARGDRPRPNANAEERLVVTVVRTGGIAGLRRQWRVEPVPEDEEQWIELIYRCPWDDPVPAESGADRYVWSIQARPPGTRLERVIPDSALDGAWMRLVKAVRAAAAS